MDLDVDFCQVTSAHKILGNSFEVPWHFHLAKLCLVSSLNLPLCSTSCLLIFYNLEMTAPWITQGKHLGKCPGEESAVTKRGHVGAVSLFSLNSLHDVSESESPVQPTDTCCCLSLLDLCNVLEWMCCWSTTQEAHWYISIHPQEEVRMWPANQNTEQEKKGIVRNIVLNYRISFYPRNMVNGPNMPLLL